MSVRLRLTLWYAALMATTVIVASVALYVVLNRNVLDETDAILEGKARDLASTIQVTGGPTVFTPTLPPLDRFAESDVYAQIVRDDGTILDESPDMGQPRVPMDAAAVRPATRGQATLNTVTVRGVRIRVYTTPVIFGSLRFVLEVGRSYGTIETTLRRLATALAVGDVLLILIAAGFGWWMAGSALRPIVRTTRAVQAIGESQRLDQRVAYDGPLDEIGELVVTFNRMLDRLEASIAAQRRFVADASHELRTPLTTLRLNVELLRRDRSAEPPERAEILGDVASELDRLSRLVHGLLDLARADAGLHLEKQAVRADELVRDVYQQVKPTADGVALVTGDLVPISLNASPDYLKQLLLTLVDNALKYTDPGGKVQIDLERDDRWVKFVVADTGRGIAPEDLPRIFDRFFRARAVRSKRGTGLGLSLAQWIAREHGGYIEVRSEPGEGSTFTVWLPVD